MPDCYLFIFGSRKEFDKKLIQKRPPQNMTTLPTTINLVTPPNSPAPLDDAHKGESEKRSVKDESLPLYDSDDAVWLGV